MTTLLLLTLLLLAHFRRLWGSICLLSLHMITLIASTALIASPQIAGLVVELRTTTISDEDNVIIDKNDEILRAVIFFMLQVSIARSTR